MTPETIEVPDGKCVLCWSAATFRLPADWQDRVNRGQSIPIVGCGNPWHYVEGDGLATPPHLTSTSPQRETGR